jgi:hypothetical protein
MSEKFDAWMASLEARHLADLRFPEVSRPLRALSSTYVERRGRIGEGAALSGAGKRAAFALFYGPLHYLLVRAIVDELPGAAAVRPTLVDLGCGTGAASAAWAGIQAAQTAPPATIGIDRHRWALDEAAKTFRAFDLPLRTRLGDIAGADLPKGRASFLAAFALNELPDTGREAMLKRLLDRASAGDQVLIVEPLAGSAAPWWKKWASAFESSGGRADEWRFRVELPPIVLKLDRAAGLHHNEITGRSLSMHV